MNDNFYAEAIGGIRFLLKLYERKGITARKAFNAIENQLAVMDAKIEEREQLIKQISGIS